MRLSAILFDLDDTLHDKSATLRRIGPRQHDEARLASLGVPLDAWLQALRETIAKASRVLDRLHAVLCAAGYSVRWLLRMIARKGLRAVLWHLPAQVAAAVRALFRREAKPGPDDAAWRLNAV